MNARPIFPRSRPWGWTTGLALALLVLIAGQAPPAEAALYWASANGVTPLNKGVLSSIPTLCFVGNAVSARPERVTQIVEYLSAFENAGTIRFLSPVSAHPIGDEIAPGGNINNLKCTASTPSGGKDFYGGDIRIVLPNTDVNALDPVPGVGCFTDRFATAPDCVARDSLNSFCVEKGVNSAAWIKHYSASSGWENWDSASLGGQFTSGLSIATLNTANLEVVGRGLDNNLWVNSWNGTWSPGGFSAIPNSSGNIASEPDCVGHDSHHLTCAARWSDDTVRVIDRDTSSGSAVWSNWHTVTGMSATAGPAITSWGYNGRVDVFTRGPLNAGHYNLIHNWSYDFGITWALATVENLGGYILGAPDCMGRPTSAGEGDIACAARGEDGSIWETSRAAGGAWTGFVTLNSPATSDPSLESRSAALISVYATGSNYSLWTGPAHLPGSITTQQADSPEGGGGWTYIGDNNNWGSWSNAPWNRTDLYYRACQYNLKLGDDPWCPVNGEYYPCPSNPEVKPYLNHTLHEVGHALGLAHEQARSDANVAGCGTGYGGSISAGFITPYDRDSVMHYQFSSCGINGNYANTGLSYYDKLAVHILYPQAGYPAEIFGNLGITAGQTLQLTSALKYWGANMSFAANSFVWRIEGQLKSTTPDLSVSGLAAGRYTLELDYNDFLGNHHYGIWTVNVFSPAARTIINTAQGAVLSPLYNPDFMVMIPIVK